ncbi:MAG: hypothetical protein JW982_06640 [Spirochaetes bacterium]|nr:hypothetical protein [Spirochaetota bacterium]
MFKSIGIIIFAALSVNFSTADYQYYVMQTTGHGRYMLTESNELIPVEFSANSNSGAVKSLEALNFGIIQRLALKYNGEGNKIFLRGKISSKEKWKPVALIMEGDRILPESYDRSNLENYYEFTLESWYIIVPFEEYIDQGPPDYEIAVHDNLTPDDFEVNIENIADIKLLQRR